MSIWKNNDTDITSKTKFAKYHALRIVKAIKANEDPNATNPVQETQQSELTSPPALDPDDPEVQRINQSTAPQLQPNPYQPYVETAPNTSARPSPNLPSAPTGYTQASHSDVSPISQSTPSRQGSVVSIGGGYFPKTDPPTFTAETTAPGLPTAPMDIDPLTSSQPGSPQAPQASGISNPASFYQNAASPPPAVPPPQQQMPTQNSFRSPPQSSHGMAASPAPQVPQKPQNLVSSPIVSPQNYQFAAPTPQPPQSQYAPQPGGFPQSIQQQYSSAPHQNPFAQQPPPPPQQYSQGPFRNDEDSIMAAQKHAKWAISALNFEDADTAVKELRIALQALGAL